MEMKLLHIKLCRMTTLSLKDCLKKSGLKDETVIESDLTKNMNIKFYPRDSKMTTDKRS